MKTTLLALAATLAVTAGMATAMVEIEDADGNGSYSMDEMMVSYPDLTESDFAELDADASGELTDDELLAAVEKGILAE